MSLHEQLREIFGLAVKLNEELDSIPSTCDCGNAEEHLEGTCCCRRLIPSLHASRTRDACRGCVWRLDRLRDRIRDFQRDVRQRHMLSLDLASGAGGRMFSIESAVDEIAAELYATEANLLRFQSTCAYEALAGLKEHAGKLAKRLDALSRVL